MGPYTSRGPAGSLAPPTYPRGAILLWMAAALLVLLSLPLFRLFDTMQEDLSNLEAAIMEAQTGRVFPPTGGELATLQARATAAASAENGLRAAFVRANQGRVPWLSVLERVIPDATSGVSLTSLRQHQDRLILQGVAGSEAALLAYSSRLQASPLFDDFQLSSAPIQPSPTPIPTSTPTVTPVPSPTPTATPNFLDAYEPDNVQPKDIALGMPQIHNFQPDSDVDRVRFVAKAGHHYRVFTSHLAPGVDTILALSISGTGYVNEDRTPGDLSSYVEFRAPPQGDRLVEVLVTNRGRFGPDATYVLTAEEVGIGDPFETDDASPCAISPGEVQARSFYPDRDVDQVYFRVKGGRWYEVATRSLAVGVDTVLLVREGTASYHSDDIAPGNYASRVTFKAAADGLAYVTITNKDRYGPSQTYELAVVELAHTPIPPSGATASAGAASHSASDWGRPSGLSAPQPRLGTRSASQPLMFVISLRLKGYQQ